MSVGRQAAIWAAVALSASIYSVPLQQWLNSFNQSDFLFLRFEELQEDLPGMMDRVFKHIGLSRVEIPDTKARNARSHYDALDKDALPVKVLRKLLAPYNKALSRLLNDEKWHESWSYETDSPLSKSSLSRQQHRFAYVWIVGGVNYEDPAPHQAYLYNILVSASVLREQGSMTDIVVYIQISNKSKATTLTEEEIRWLQHFDIELRYLEKSSLENFATINMQKTIILNMTEYDRVLYLDTDVTVLGNVDYLFVESMKGRIQGNLAVPAQKAPLNGGFIMVTPGLYGEAQQHIAKKFQHFFGSKTAKNNGPVASSLSSVPAATKPI